MSAMSPTELRALPPALPLGQFEVCTGYMDEGVSVERTQFCHSIVKAVDLALSFLGKYEEQNSSAFIVSKGTRIWEPQSGFLVVEAKALYSHLLALESAVARSKALEEKLTGVLAAANGQVRMERAA